MALACDELRLIGVHEKLGTQLQELPPTLSGLVLSRLTRLENEFTPLLLRAALSLLLSSESGISFYIDNLIATNIIQESVF